MSSYAWSSVRARAGTFVAAFVAMASAAALVAACGALLETGLRGTIATERYAATPVVVGADQQVRQVTVSEKKGKAKEKRKAKPLSGRAWLPAGTVEELSGLPGVRAAVGEITFPAHAVDAEGRVHPGPGATGSLGHGWGSAPLTPFRLVEGAPPGADDEVVVDRELAARLGLGPGDRLTVRARDTVAPYRVVGIAAPGGADLEEQTSLFFTDVEAARLSGRDGAVMAVGLLPEPGASPEGIAEAARAAVAGTGAQVHTGDGRGRMEHLGADRARIQLVSMGAAMGGTSLLVALLVVVGTFSLSLQRRQRELALLRAVAATPRQVRRMIGREALLVGLAAAVLGALAGLVLAAWLHGEMVGLGAVPGNLPLVRSPFPAAAAVGAVVLGGWAAARLSARRVARVRPAEALAEAATERPRIAGVRVAVGVLVAAGGGVLLAVLGTLRTEAASTPVTFVTVLVLAVAASLLGPLLVRGAVALLGLPLRAAPVGGHLVAANVRAATRRVAGAVTPLALLVAMACTVAFTPTTVAAAAGAEVRAGTVARWVLDAPGPGVPRAAAEAVRALDGVVAVTEVVRTEVHLGLGRYPAQGVTTEGLARTWDPGVVAGSLDDLDDGGVALSERAAGDRGVGPGDILPLTLADGAEVELTVAAVYRRGLGFGDVTLPHALVVEHVDEPSAAVVLVATDRSDAGGSVGERAALAGAVADLPGVTVRDREQMARLAADPQEGAAGARVLAMGLVVAFTAIAVVNTLAMTVGERARELALLRLVGATRRQVRRMLRLEGLLLSALAVALGTGIALAVLTAFSRGMTGRAVPAVDPVTYLLVVGLGTLLALVATMVPARWAMAGRPSDVVGQGP